jgi:hypothetical protein
MPTPTVPPKITARLKPKPRMRESEVRFAPSGGMGIGRIAGHLAGIRLRIRILARKGLGGIVPSERVDGREFVGY